MQKKNLKFIRQITNLSGYICLIISSALIITNNTICTAAETQPTTEQIIVSNKPVRPDNTPFRTLPKSKPVAAPIQQSEEIQQAETQSVQTQAQDKVASLYGNAQHLIWIHKDNFTMQLFAKGTTEAIKTYKIALGKNTGDKKQPNDNTTPTSWGSAVTIPEQYEGAKAGIPSEQVPYRIEEICDSSWWKHDFHDRKGEIAGAYGPWFISIDTGWEGIGIHGTHDVSTIGKLISEGCIRLANTDLEELKTIITKNNAGIGVPVVITEE